MNLDGKDISELSSYIFVNDKKEKGYFVVEIISSMLEDKSSESGYVQYIEIKGKIVLEKYYSEISKLEDDHYILNDVTVTKEAIVSNSPYVEYTFNAKGFQVKKQ